MHATRLTTGVPSVHAGNNGLTMGRPPFHLRAIRRATSALATVGSPRTMRTGTAPMPTVAALQHGKILMLLGWTSPGALTPTTSGTAWVEGPGNAGIAVHLTCSVISLAWHGLLQASIVCPGQGQGSPALTLRTTWQA